MAEEVLVILNRSESAGFGFSLLGKPGLPPIIYNILDDSPAAESGEVQVGDVILKVNETDVNRFSTKEVLKCLRLSSDPVTLKIKRDPYIKATLRKHLLSSVAGDADNRNRSGGVGGGGGGPYHLNRNTRPEPGVHQTGHARTNGSCPIAEEEPLLGGLQYQQQQQQQQHHNQQQQEQQQQNNGRLQWEPLAAGDKASQRQPKFEAYMMTGEHILNISRMPQSAAIIPKQQKKVDSLRYHNSHTHHLRHQQHNSVPNSPNEMDLGMKNDHHCRSGSNSANTSPVSANRWEGLSHPSSHQQQNHPPTGAGDSTTSAVPKAYGQQNFVRTSRSEDQLQGGQNDYCGGMSSTNVNDEDMTSSLNTLLDTRPDSAAAAAAAAAAFDGAAAEGGGSEGNNVSSGASGDSDRIVWTYNAPMTAEQLQLYNQQQLLQQQQQHFKAPFCHTLSNGSGGSNNGGSRSGSGSSQHTTVSSSVSPSSSSPLHSPASPTSVSSSVMSSSQSGSRRLLPPTPSPSPASGTHYYHHGAGGSTSAAGNNGGDCSVSEAMSNISSPDYHDDDYSIGGLRECDAAMEISDHSDSDSTLLVSEPRQRHHRNSGNSASNSGNGDHRIVIQVKGPDKDGRDRGKGCDSVMNVVGRSRMDTCCGYQISDTIDQDIDEEIARDFGKSPSPQSSEDESDIDSLHSFHYSPKAVDLPSAIRLAKRLYSLDGFKKSDVSRHLSKNNDFSRAVAEEYLKYFDFENDTLDIALRKFLKQFSLTGETQERERVLVHFSKRFLDCNPGSFNSQDAVHTLTCAIMLLNTDLHGQNMNRKMTCNEFIENLAGLNECENFPRDVLKQLYHAIKNYPLEWALDEDVEDGAMQVQKNNDQHSLGGNPFLDVPVSSNAVEYKKGYVMRKCCYEANAKRTPFHKRSWKMFYCTLRDLVLYLHKDENGFRKNQMSDNFNNAIRIHHALATKAVDYTKKQYVFRLQTADQAEYLFQTSDSKELQSWIDTINFVCASFSAPPLEAAVGSQKKFQRPLLPCSHTKLNLREQLRDHEERVVRLEAELDDHRKCPPERGAKSLTVQNYKEKENYLNYEVKRYRTYAFMLRSRMAQYPEGIILIENSIGEVDEASGLALAPTTSIGSSGVTLMEGLPCGGSGGGIVPPPIPERPSPPINRYSYRQAIYNRNLLNGADAIDMG